LGSGVGGGVELTLHNLVLGLSARGHGVEVMAPEGSLHLGERTHQVRGALQPGGHLAKRDEPICIPPNSVLANMWALARERQSRYDVIINLAYDWLPFYLSSNFKVPVAHLVSMASITNAMDEVINECIMSAPMSVAMHSRAQADTFALGSQVRIVGSGVALERYDFVSESDVSESDVSGGEKVGYLGFIGRISPEKGILDLFAAASATGRRVKAWGLMQDQSCWDEAGRAYPQAHVTYEGFLPTDELQSQIGGCSAILMTSKWVEAFGNVALEAMACGVPVIAYDRGGPSEVVIHGKTGFLVAPDDVEGLARAVARINEISRDECRRHVDQHYSTAVFSQRVETWLHEVVRVSRGIGIASKSGQKTLPI